jgi:hypothetical protein
MTCELRRMYEDIVGFFKELLRHLLQGNATKYQGDRSFTRDLKGGHPEEESAGNNVIDCIVLTTK